MSSEGLMAGSRFVLVKLLVHCEVGDPSRRKYPMLGDFWRSRLGL